MNPKDYLSIRSCRQCGKLYNTVLDIKVCPSCYKRNEEKFKIVKAYIREHPDAPMYKISEHCDVSERQIMTWIREERLMVRDESGILIECLQCGAPIKTGKYCSSCKTRMVTEFKGVYREPTLSETSKKLLKEHKMRFLGKDRNK